MNLDNEIIFAVEHAKICISRRSRSPSHLLRCGRKLYKFLKEHNEPLDIYYNQKRLGLYTPLTPEK